MHLITGHGASDHITSADIGSFNKGIFGSETYILLGSILTNPGITQVSGSTYKMNRFDVVMCGRHARFDGTEEISLPATASGRYRRDAIVVNYKKESGIETCDVTVAYGEPVTSESAAAAPSVSPGARPDVGSSSYRSVIMTVLMYGSAVRSVEYVAPIVTTMEVLTNKAKLVDSHHEVLSHAKVNSGRVVFDTIIESEKNINAGGNVNASGNVNGTNVKAADKVTAVNGMSADKGNIEAKTGSVQGEYLRTRNSANGAVTGSRVRSYPKTVLNNKVTESFAELALVDADGTFVAGYRVYNDGKHGLYIDNAMHAEKYIAIGSVTFGKKLITKNIGEVVIPKEAAADGKAHTLKVTDEVGDVQEKTITFGAKFIDPPKVVVTPVSSMPDQIHCSVSAITTTGCKIYFSRDGSTDETTVNWIATGRVY